MLEIQINDNEFNRIKNSFVYEYSNPHVDLALTIIIQEWNKFKDEYFICFNNEKKESLYCKLLSISISMQNNELMYFIKIRPNYIIDEKALVPIPMRV